MKFIRSSLLLKYLFLFFDSSAYPPSGYQQQSQRPSIMTDPYSSSSMPPNQAYPNQVPSNYLYKKQENPTTDSSTIDNQDSSKGNKLLMNQLRSPFSSTSMLPTSTPISILTSSTTTSTATNATITPSSISTTSFPPNSVEATTLSSKSKRKKLTAKDVSMYHKNKAFFYGSMNLCISSSSCRSMEANDVVTWWSTC